MPNLRRLVASLLFALNENFRILCDIFFEDKSYFKITKSSLKRKKHAEDIVYWTEFADNILRKTQDPLYRKLCKITTEKQRKERIIFLDKISLLAGNMTVKFRKKIDSVKDQFIENFFQKRVNTVNVFTKSDFLEYLDFFKTYNLDHLIELCSKEDSLNESELNYELSLSVCDKSFYPLVNPNKQNTNDLDVSHSPDKINVEYPWNENQNPKFLPDILVKNRLKTRRGRESDSEDQNENDKILKAFENSNDDYFRRADLSKINLIDKRSIAIQTSFIDDRNFIHISDNSSGEETSYITIIKIKRSKKPFPALSTISPRTGFKNRFERVKNCFC